MNAHETHLAGSNWAWHRTGPRLGKRGMHNGHEPIAAATETGNGGPARAAMIADAEASERRVCKGEK